MSGRPGFFGADERLRALSAAGDPPERLAAAVDFEPFRAELDAALGWSDRAKSGRLPHDPALMFKVLVLQALHTLSDEQAEYQLEDRPSFMRFTGLALHDAAPDATTIRLFRERLVRAGATERLFARFDGVLRERGLLAMGGQIVDATVGQARPARLTAEEKATLRGGGTPADWPPAREARIDRDARWTLRRGRKRPPPGGGMPIKRQAVAIAVPVFGHKSHLGIDRAHGLIRTWTVTHAAARDGGQLGALLGPADTASGVWADTAYRSAANLDLLARRERVGRLRRKKPRGEPMPRDVAHGDTRRGKVRAAVEHVLAAQERRLGLVVRTVEIARAGARIGLANLAYNLIRFAAPRPSRGCLTPRPGRGRAQSGGELHRSRRASARGRLSSSSEAELLPAAALQEVGPSRSPSGHDRLQAGAVGGRGPDGGSFAHPPELGPRRSDGNRPSRPVH